MHHLRPRSTLRMAPRKLRSSACFASHVVRRTRRRPLALAGILWQGRPMRRLAPPPRLAAAQPRRGPALPARPAARRPACRATRATVAHGAPLTIVAFGSSSTEGAASSGPDATYPAQLEARLRAALPGLPAGGAEPRQGRPGGARDAGPARGRRGGRAPGAGDLAGRRQCRAAGHAARGIPRRAGRRRCPAAGRRRRRAADGQPARAPHPAGPGLRAAGRGDRRPGRGDLGRAVLPRRADAGLGGGGDALGRR